ncbi:MAG: hypothetical protein ABIF01_00220 [Candidatus Micrarchaeota archaeon]
MGEGGSSITGKVWGGVRTDVAYHIDTAAVPFERTWDWAKVKTVQLATFVVLTSAATILIDGGVRFTFNGGFSGDNKERRGEILSDSFGKATSDYWSVAKPVGQAAGTLIFEAGKLAVNVVYEIGKAGINVIAGEKGNDSGQGSNQKQAPNRFGSSTSTRDNGNEVTASFASVRTTESKKPASYTAQQSSMPSFARDRGKEKMAFPKPDTARVMQVAQVARSRLGPS